MWAFLSCLCLCLWPIPVEFNIKAGKPEKLRLNMQSVGAAFVSFRKII